MSPTLRWSWHSRCLLLTDESGGQREMLNRLKFVLPGALLILPLGLSASFAQEAQRATEATDAPPAQQTCCGSMTAPMARADEVLMPQPADLGDADNGTNHLSAVQGRILHMEGPMVLLDLQT